MKNLAELFAALRQPHQVRDAAHISLDSCLSCGADLAGTPLYEEVRICPGCRFHYTIGARERIALLADSGSFRESHRALISIDPISFAGAYKRALFEEERRTGLPDAIVTGSARLGGRDIELAVIDFRFLGGSIGSVVGEKLTSAMEGAARHKRPLVAVVASGGARIQEGPLALLQMGKITLARGRMAKARMPFICVLANPALGAAYAGIGAHADYLIGEPGALIGYAAARAPGGTPDEQSVDDLLRRGLIDEVVDRAQQRDLIMHVLDVLTARTRIRVDDQAHPSPPHHAHGQAWNHVQMARQEHRPTALDFIGRMASTFIELRGDGAGHDTHAVTAGVATIEGEAVVIAGQQRTAVDEPAADTWLPAEGFRKAERAFRLAARFNLPIITLIDSPGADPRPAATIAGLGQAMAACIAALAESPAPTVAAVIGEGGSEAAVAFGVADRVLMLEHAIYTVVSPERAALLLHRDVSRAEEVADALHLTADACRELKVIDAVVPEPAGGAHLDHETAAANLRLELLRALASLQGTPPKKLLPARYDRYRSIGEYSSYIGTTLVHEVTELRHAIARRAGAAAARIRHPRRRQERDQPAASTEEELAIP